MSTGVNIDLYLFSPTEPTLAMLAVSGTNVTNRQLVNPNIPDVWRISYNIPTMNYSPVNTILRRYFNSTALGKLAVAKDTYQSRLPSIDVPQFDDENRRVLNSLRYQYCFHREPSSALECPNISRFHSPSETVKCSRVVSTSSNMDSLDFTNFIQCGDLATTLTNPRSPEYPTLSNVFRAYCNRHPDSYDCQCYNRNNDNQYRELKTALGAVGANDLCWYTPCGHQSYIFLPPELITANEKMNCPPACANVIMASEVGGNVNMKNISMVNNCFNAIENNAIATPPPSVRPSTQSPKSDSRSQALSTITPKMITTTTSPPPATGIKSWSIHDKRVWIISGSIVALLVIVISVSVVMLRKRTTQRPAQGNKTAE